MKRIFITIILLVVVLTGCATVDLNAAPPVYETGVDPDGLGSDP